MQPVACTVTGDFHHDDKAPEESQEERPCQCRPRSNCFIQAISRKVGMRYYNKRKNQYYCPIINLDKLWALYGEEAREAAAEDTSKAAVIDVTKHGIFKVLGKGELPEQPILVKAKFVSKLAEKKIKAVGGAVELVA
eukprot:jgi/Botrbrau1/23319/Bobra.0102s0056.1